uniref:Neprosin PEP catalytic domain-containing protein n=1 Tax=Arundo donax TaxID=35708 RepID=A0A0A9AFA4_ARUDO
MNGFMAGWHIWPSLYKDSHTHFYTAWTSAGPGKDCLNLACPGFQKTSSSITNG